MFRIYIKAAWRHLLRNKGYSALNILGLGMGMAIALIIGLWVHNQYRWDRYLPGFEQAYQVKVSKNEKGKVQTVSNVCMPLWDVLHKEVPELAYVAPAFGPVANMLTAGARRLTPEGLVVGSEFLDVFGFPMVAGDPHTALKDPNSVVLTESTAVALFGNTDVLGKTLLIDDNTPRRVTAVLKDLPDYSTFHFRYLSVFDPPSATGYWHQALEDWRLDFCPIYVALKPNVSYAQLGRKIRGLIQDHAPGIYRENRAIVSMQAMEDWRLYTKYENGVAKGGLIDYIQMFSIIGVLVLVIACINFINLSTARSEKRAREVGIRKVVGSSRAELVIQFLTESLLLTFFSFLVSLVLAQLLLPAFDAITATDIRIPWSSGYFWMILAVYVVVTGLLAGCRPAFYLSSFRPVRVLKGKIGIGRAVSWPRKVLVVVQFTCSIALIIGTIIVYQQLQYARQRPTGLNMSRLVTGDAAYYPYRALKQEVLRSGLVSNMTKSNASPVGMTIRLPITGWAGKQADESLNLAMNCVADADYFSTMGIPFVAGRDFVGRYYADSADVILSEAAVKRMRLKQPIGQLIDWTAEGAPPRLRVIGVVKDALSLSPFAPAEPTMYVYQPQWCFTLNYRLAPQVSTPMALAGLKAIFEGVDPRTTFSYHFVDEQYAAEFKMEVLTGKLAAIFSILAVFISCLGLFGLAAYMAEQRTREIGIRKVLGASITQIVAMLGKEFIVLVLVSCVIAAPIAYYFLHRWLEEYYYRIDIGPGVFVLAAAIAVLVTVATISFHAIRSAIANPVDSLRAE